MFDRVFLELISISSSLRSRSWSSRIFTIPYKTQMNTHVIKIRMIRSSSRSKRASFACDMIEGFDDGTGKLIWRFEHHFYTRFNYPDHQFNLLLIMISFLYLFYYFLQAAENVLPSCWNWVLKRATKNSFRKNKFENFYFLVQWTQFREKADCCPLFIL